MMYTPTLALALALSFLQKSILVDAGVYVLKPQAHSICHGGKSCTIEWLDDGIRPLLSAAGVCTLGLYTGNMKLVQALPPVDVSTTSSITFKPNSSAGPNSNSYYIAIISTTTKANASDPSSGPYMAFSPFFTIDQMTGSFNSPLPQATSTIPIPSSLTQSATTTSLSTITVGTLSTSLPPLPTISVTSPIVKSTTTSFSSHTRLTTSKATSSTSSSSFAVSVTSSSKSTSASAASTSSNASQGQIQLISLGFTASVVVTLLSSFLMPLL